MLRLAVLAALAANPTLAQEAAWPPEFVRIIDEAKSYCAGSFSVAPEAARQVDLNGDGQLDWVLDAGGFACSDSYGLYCGTQGCNLDTLIDGQLGALILRRWDIVTEGGTTYLTAPNDQGRTVRFHWTGTEWEFLG